MSWKKVQGDISSDRISNLPSDLRDCILARLPLRDAVQTSVLSTQWRYNWLTIPHLIFDWDLDDREFIVSHVLRIHKGPITKFSFTGCDCFDLDIVDEWFQLLSKHSGIEDLELHLEGGSEYVLPQSLFSFENLHHLRLKDVEIKLPSTFKGFNKLVTLTLEEVWNVFDMLKTLTSKCRNLEVLYVHSFDMEPGGCLDIAAPNLEKFHFRGLFSSIYLKCPRIKEVSLDFDCGGSTYMEEGLVHDNFELPYSHRIKNNLVKVFCQMPSIEHVKLKGNELMQFMAVGSVPQELPNKLNHLTRLNMAAIDLGCEGVVRIVICLIRSSPNLMCLQICSHVDESMPGAIQYLKAQQECEVRLCCLRIVEVHDILYTEPDMEFIKLIFLWASALEKLEVRMFGRWIWFDRIQVLERLASFHRSSSNAVLTFK